MRNVSLLFIASFIALFIRCGGSPDIVDSGSATDVADASISGFVVDTSGNPSGGTFVYLIPKNYNPVVDTGSGIIQVDTTDFSGSYNFSAESGNTFTLLASNVSNSTSCVKSNIIVEEEDTLSFIDTLKGPYSLTVELPESASQLNGYVYLRGTMISKRVQGETEYLLIDSVPFGDKPTAVYVEDDGYSGPVVLNRELVFVDNFDKNSNYNVLHSITGNGEWQLYSSPELLLEPAEALDDFTAALTSEGAYSGMSLNVTFYCDSNPYAYAKTFIWPGDGEYADLTSLTAISFYIKGSGRIRLNMVSKKAMDYDGPQKEGQIGSVVSCTEEWRKVVLYPEDLTPPPGSQQEADGLDWETVCDSVSDITFRTWYTHEETVELWLDDIILYGVSEEDFQR